MAEFNYDVMKNRDVFEMASKDNEKYFDGLQQGVDNTREGLKEINEYIQTDAERLKDAYDRRQTILDNAHSQGLVSEDQYQQSKNKLIEKYNEEAAKSSEDYWVRYLESTKESLESFDELTASTVENFTRGFGDAFEKVIFDSQTLGDAWRNLVDGMARAIINAIGQMIAQWIAYQTVQLLVGKSTQSSAATAMIANAQATSLQAQLAAYASTAAIPITGPFMAPAALVAAAAVTEPLVAGVAAAAVSGMAHEGHSNIPKEGTWLLDGGERVIAPEQNKDLTRFLSEKKDSGTVVNVYEDRSRAGEVKESEQDGRKIIDVFVADLMGDGRSQQAISRKFGMRGVGS